MRVIFFVNFEFDNFQIFFLSHDYVSNTYRDRFELSSLCVLRMKKQSENRWSFLIFLLTKKLNFFDLLDLFLRRQKTFIFIWLNVYVQIFARCVITLWWCFYYLRILCIERRCRFWNLFNFRQRVTFSSSVRIRHI